MESHPVGSKLPCTVGHGIASEPSAETGKFTKVHPRGSTDCFLWLYKDQRGCAHGPYPEERMATWFIAGNLKMSLPVKRVCDVQFQLLGDIIKTTGRVPFQTHEQRQGTAPSDPGCSLPLTSHVIPVRDADLMSKSFPFPEMQSLYPLPRPSAVTRFLIGHGRTYDNIIPSTSYIPLLAKVEPLSDLPTLSKVQSLPSPGSTKGDAKERRPEPSGARADCKVGHQRTAMVTLVQPSPHKTRSQHKTTTGKALNKGKPATSSAPAGTATTNAKDTDEERRLAADRYFTRWSCTSLSKFPSYIHVPTFFELLRDVESNAEIREYVQMHLGDSEDVRGFAQEFIRKRAYWKWVTGRKGPLDVSEDSSGLKKRVR
ncbi:uncharacterized protein LOC135393850 [Ornithodoros turicata]|uniref:uncharacterized protein LOC135393850 n=1 Tax=Ornithodoros turicata TaxID=34597 RepID=UPI003139A2A7